MSPSRYPVPLFTGLLLIAAAPAVAQPYFDAPWRAFDATAREWVNEGLMCVAAGDLNGDGLPDVVTGQMGVTPPGLPPGVEGFYVYLNEGDAAGDPATFAPAAFYETGPDPHDVKLADLDGDGDLDIAAAAFFTNVSLPAGGSLVVLRNAGDGTFGPPAYFDAGPQGASGVDVADLDGDGDLDVVAANAGPVGTTVSVFRNHGDGTFAARVAYAVGEAGVNEVAAGDLDGDGDADLAVSHDDPARVSVLFNDGGGAFGPATAYTGLFTGGNPGIWLYSSVVLLDPDADGDLDVAYTASSAYSYDLDDSVLALLRNDGAGAFTVDRYPYGVPQQGPAIDLTVVDLDGDGYEDLLGAQFQEHGYAAFGGFYTFHNDGAGGFLPARPVYSVADLFDVAAADLDADGDPDAITVNRFYPIIGAHGNPGDGRFDVRPVFGSLFVHNVLDLGDVDNDGHVDAATSHSGAISSYVNVLLGGGDGTFTESFETPGSAYGFAKLRHLDGDGNLDLLFVSGPNAPPYDFFTAKGNGDGTFGPTIRWPVGTCGSAHPGAFDLDGDGDLDVVNTEDRGCFGQLDHFLYVSRNNGNGTFQPPYGVPIEGRTRNVTAGDFDEDGHLDLVTAWPSSTILFGHGDGTFDPEQPLPGSILGENVLALDLDGDGHLDLATLTGAGDPAIGEAWLQVLWGDGTGSFTASVHGIHPAPFARIWVDAGDVDGDGDLDVVADGVQDALVMVNEGNRSFTYSGRYGISSDSRAVHYADTDGDGIGDLVALAGPGLAVVPGLTGPTAPVAVSAAPVDPPVTIPPGGGSFRFTVTLTNTTAEPQTFQAWSEVTGPVDRSPVLGPLSVTLPPGATVTRTLRQRVPGAAPAGTYTYAINVGDFPSTVRASDAFAFEKEGAARGDVSEPGWAVSGWDEAPAAGAALPDGFALSEAYPNPFSRQAALTLEVAEPQAVRAEVYDALGRRVVVLHDGEVEAGEHALVLDGSSLPAGVYVVRVTGEAFAATRRAVLLR